jgi:hypothetical protein
MPPVAIIAAAVIGAGAGAWAAQQKAQAAKDAANNISQGEQQAAQTMQAAYSQQQSGMSPYTKAGAQAIGQLSTLSGNQTMKMNNDPSYQAMRQQLTQQFKYDPNTDPGTQYRIDQATGAVNSSAAAKGGYFSGSTGLALQEAGQAAASQEYGAAHNRWLQDQQLTGQEYQSEFNRENLVNQQNYSQLAGLAQTGQQAQTQVGAWGMDTGQYVGNTQIASGQAQAAGLMGQGTEWAGAIINAGSQAQTALKGLSQ